MLDAVELINFQGHKCSRLELHPGVNIIAGPSDNGKSAIIRGFNWVLFNRPQGTSFIRKGQKEASVSLQTNSGFVVVRSRDAVENKYEIFDMEVPSGAEGQHVFRAIKADVPEDVYSVLNMNDINLQKQGTPYFLLSDTPGDVSRKLNQAANLDIVDATQRKINSMAVTAKSKITYTIEQIDRLDADIAAMPDPATLTSILDELEGTLYDQQCHAEMRNLLQNDIKRAEDLTKHIAECNVIAQLKPLIDDLCTHIDRRKKLSQQRAILESIHAQGHLEAANLDALPNTAVASQLLNAIDPLLKARGDLAVQGDILENYIQQTRTVVDKILPGCDASITASKAELDAFMATLDVCPLCNQEIPHADHGDGRPAPAKVVTRKPKG